MLIEPTDLIGTTNQIMLMRLTEQYRLARISKCVRGHQDPPYVPRGASTEYRWIMRKSLRNFLPLVVSVISQNLHVDGYRPEGQTNITANAVLAPQRTTNPMWDAFRANRMVSRQHGVHRSVIKFGSAYAVVLPGQLSTDEEQQGTDVPVMRPVSPRRMTALYASDVDDEWPQVAVEVKTVNMPGNKVRSYVSVYDEQFRYILSGSPGVAATGGGSQSVTQLNLQLADPEDPILAGQAPVSEHGLGVCPVVRFLYEADLDGESDCSGEVEPIMPVQDQINFDTFNLMMSEQYSAFRQRWIAGMAPVDAEGRDAAPFRPGVDRVWAAEDPGTHFGEFSETALAPYSTVREDGIRHMATITQVPPYHLLGQVANLSAEALAAARDGLDRKIQELQALLTDPWRNVFRLTALASGDKENWNDLFGTVVWRDTSARAFGSTIDGLTKVAQMLGVPEEELWSRVPGVTAEDVQAWQLAAQREQAQQIVQQAVSAGQIAGVPNPATGVPALPGQTPQPFANPAALPPAPAGPGGAPQEPGA